MSARENAEAIAAAAGMLALGMAFDFVLLVTCLARRAFGCRP